MTKKESAMKFFRNPIAGFIYAALLVLAVVIFAEPQQQIKGVIGVCVTFTLISFAYVIWEEKISARRYQKENAELQKRLTTIEAERRRLSASNIELEREIPKVIKYNRVHKRIKIEDNSGNATLSITYDGINISNEPIQIIKHTIATKKQLLSIKKLLINEEEVIPRIEPKPYGNGYETEIILDALEAIDPGDPIVSFYEVELDEEYREAFEENKESISTHSIYLRTDELIMEIEAPDGFIFHPNPRIDVLDLFHGTEILEEKNRINKDKECRPTLDSSRF